MECKSQNPEFRNNPENFYSCEEDVLLRREISLKSLVLK